MCGLLFPCLSDERSKVPYLGLTGLGWLQHHSQHHLMTIIQVVMIYFLIGDGCIMYLLVYTVYGIYVYMWFRGN